MAATSTRRPLAAVTVVHSPACHFCEDARNALFELSATYPLTVEYIAADDPRGQVLAAVHRAGMFPLVLLEGQFFSSGRLPRKKLRALLETRAMLVSDGTVA